MVDAVVTVGITAVLAAVVFMPDSITSTRRRIERRARDWTPTAIAVPADSALIATNVEVAGTWRHQLRLTGSSLVFTKRSQHEYDVQFATGGCLGGCRFRRVAYAKRGVVTLNDAVAEYMPRTYNTLYVVRVSETEYLLPAESTRAFERKLATGSDDWKFFVFARDDESKEPAEAGATQPSAPGVPEIANPP